MARRDDVSCSFCGKRGRQVRRIIAGPGVFICNECVALCASIIDDEDHRAQRPWAQAVAAGWWRRGLCAAGRLIGRRPAWRASVR